MVGRSKRRTMEIWDAYNDKREKIGQYLVRGDWPISSLCECLSTT